MPKAKKKRGPGRPPSTGIGKLLGVRAHPPLIKRIDDWAERQDDKPSRAEAMRRLIETGLSAQPETSKTTKETGRKASRLASEAIDSLSDQSAPADVQAQRKRRLLKGPSEFREMRNDLPKAKS
jgi:hypothetical protein